MATEQTQRKTVQAGGVGGGHLECDGKDHWWVVEDHKTLNCLPETHVGPCRNQEMCKAMAEQLAKQKGQ